MKRVIKGSNDLNNESIKVNTIITPELIEKAETVLIDNGFDEDDAYVVLQAIGYVLLDTELYPESDED